MGDWNRVAFAFRPELRLAVTGGGQAVRHFQAEYGPAAAEATTPAGVELAFASRVGSAQGIVVAGAHKTVRWDVALGPPDSDSLRAVVALRGRPRSFGLSLVQGYFVEPLLAIAAARGGCILLPAAAFQEGDAAVLLVGRSRSGKSSICARALAAGRAVLGDDHVLLARGHCYPFPRRMRFYSDLRQTAVRAYATLPAGARAGLVGRSALRTLTRGYVAPPVRVSQNRVGRAPAATPLPLGRVVLVERDARALGVESETYADGTRIAVANAVEALSEQREKLRAARDDAWTDALEATRRHEASLLAEAFHGTPVERIVVPERWGAAQAITALAERLAIDG